LDSAKVAVLDETTYTIEFPMSLFTAEPNGNPDAGEKLIDIGLYDNTPFLSIVISSNLDSTFSWQMDNFRIRQILPSEGGGGLASSVPEPASGVLGAWALMVVSAFHRRRRRTP